MGRLEADTEGFEPSAPYWRPHLSRVVYSAALARVQQTSLHTPLHLAHRQARRRHYAAYPEPVA